MAKSKYARLAEDDDSDSAPSTSKRAKSGPGKKGKSYAPLAAPSWPATKLRERSASVEPKVVDHVFFKCLKKLPSRFLLRFLEQLSVGNDAVDPDDPPTLYSRIASDVEGLIPAVRERVTNPIPLSLHPRNLSVLAAHFGAKVPDPSEWVSDGTIQSMTDLTPDVAREVLVQRSIPEFQAYTTCPSIFSDHGLVRCFCGQTASFKQVQVYQQKGKFVDRFHCTEGRCRFNITSGALALLKDLMADLGVDRIPVWFCPLHPEQDLRITQEFEFDKELKISVPTDNIYLSCPHVETKGGKKEFCIREILGDDSTPHLATGVPFWRTMAAMESPPNA
jgi:hypothetical protein